MNLSSQLYGSSLCILVQDTRIDAAVAVQFKDKVRSLSDGHKGRLILDLKHVDFIDSSGLGALVSVMKGLPAGICLELTSPSSIVQKVLKLTRMDEVFKIFASVEDALHKDQTTA